MRGRMKEKIKAWRKDDDADAFHCRKGGHVELSGRQDHDSVDTSVGQSAVSNHTLDITSGDNIIIKTLHREKTSINIKEDIKINSEEGDINGAIIDVYQSIEIFQSSNIKIKIKERGDNIIVKVKIFERTNIDMDTDIDVLLTNAADFDVDIVQTAHIVQDKSTQIKVQGNVSFDLDLLLSQIAQVDQEAYVTFAGSADDFTVSVHADQDVYATQQITLDVSADDLWIA